MTNLLEQRNWENTEHYRHCCVLHSFLGSVGGFALEWMACAILMVASATTCPIWISKLSSSVRSVVRQTSVPAIPLLAWSRYSLMSHRGWRLSYCCLSFITGSFAIIWFSRHPPNQNRKRTMNVDQNNISNIIHSSEYLIYTSIIGVSALPHHLRIDLCISMTNMSHACLNGAVCSHVVSYACWTVE